MTSNERQALEIFAREVKEKFPGAEIFLFGSKARGDDEPYSDMDIMVILPEYENEMSSAIDEIAHRVGTEYDVLLTTIIDSKDHFESPLGQAMPLYQSVMKEGIKI